MLDQLKQIYYLIPLPILIGIAIHSVNYWNATDLEKKFMTNLQKLKISFSLILFASLILTVLSSATFLIRGDSLTIFLVVGGFIFSFVLLLINAIMSWSCINLFSFKSNYFIFLENDTSRWLILKTIGKRELLLQRGEGEYNTITNWNNKIIIKENNLLYGWRSSFYSANCWFYITTVVIVITLLISAISMYFIQNNLWSIIMFFLLISTSVSLLTILTNLFWYQNARRN